MFGHVQANINDLTVRENDRYGAAYCGLCHALGEDYGFHSRLGLTYDLTFLSLLLASLYEPEETKGECRCVVHPLKKHSYVINECTHYAADMTIALVYHKCLDDWLDDKKLSRKCYAQSIRKSYIKVKNKWPLQCEIIERELKEIARVETDSTLAPDLAVNACGRMMEAVFSYKDDLFLSDMKKLGYEMGRYIYLADACVDYEKDMKKGSYNPLCILSSSPEDMKPMLKVFLGEASAAFEKLPLVQDIEILRNILYSGIWVKYNQKNSDRKKGETGG